KLESGSRRRWKGRSGSPKGRTSCSVPPARRLQPASPARASPATAPSGKSVRPAKRTLEGRSRPARPIKAQAARRAAQPVNGDAEIVVTGGETELASYYHRTHLKCEADRIPCH